MLFKNYSDIRTKFESVHDEKWMDEDGVVNKKYVNWLERILSDDEYE